jgi:sensor histidine kinase YesM
VENTGQLAEEETRLPRLGLNNIRERLRILYSGRASLELTSRDGRVAATVRIPICQ